MLDTQVANEASSSFPSYEATTRTFTRANMQRSDSASKGGGIFARFLSSANTDARIERLHKKLAWTGIYLNARHIIGNCIAIPYPSRTGPAQAA